MNDIQIKVNTFNWLLSKSFLVNWSFQLNNFLIWMQTKRVILMLAIVTKNEVRLKNKRLLFL